MHLMETSKFWLDMTNLKGNRALNCPGVLAGANFITLRRACVLFLRAFIPWCEALSFGEAFRRKPCFNKKWLPRIFIKVFDISIVDLRAIGDYESALFLKANRLV